MPEVFSRLDLFAPSADRGVPRWKEVSWYVVKMAFFLTAIPWPARLKARLLRTFGATIGTGVVIAPMVNIHMPWKLVVGDHSWIGQETFLLNLERIVIGAHCCISQRAFLCTGNHNYKSRTFDYLGAEIEVGNGSWIGASAFIGPGVTIGDNAVITAGSVVLESAAEDMVHKGNPSVPARRRLD